MKKKDPKRLRCVSMNGTRRSFFFFNEGLNLAIVPLKVRMLLNLDRH